MSKLPCYICHKKTLKECGLCEEPTCKTCLQTLAIDHFKFMHPVPSEFTKGQYCNPCFSQQISEPLHQYDTLLEQAKDMNVYFKDKHSKLMYMFKIAKVPIVIEDSNDYDDLILQLAYAAAAKGHKDIVNVEIESRKVFDGSYKKLLWTGKCFGATKR